jgi:anti-anti-sigma factor
MAPHRSPVGHPDGDDPLVDVQLEVNADLARVRITGELDFFTSVTLADHLAQVVASGAPCAVVELEETTFVALAAFRVLLDTAELLSARGASMVVRNAPPSLRILHEIVGTPTLVLEDSASPTLA